MQYTTLCWLGLMILAGGDGGQRVTLKLRYTSKGPLITF